MPLASEGEAEEAGGRGGGISPPPVSQDLMTGSKRFKRHSIARVSAILKHSWLTFFDDLCPVCYMDVKIGIIFAGRHGSLQIALEATVLIGR